MCLCSLSLEHEDGRSEGWGSSRGSQRNNPLHLGGYLGGFLWSNVCIMGDTLTSSGEYTVYGEHKGNADVDFGLRR